MPQPQEPSPGEWSAVASVSSDLGAIRYITADGKAIASVWCRRDIDQDEALANANMLAAAKVSHESNVELAAIVREMCAAHKIPLPEAALDRSRLAAAQATGVKVPGRHRFQR
ncbi:MAG: hypothetical protein O9327_02345 [Polaromonas sp.]|jgi:hypothetical protein|nr:hypothetical protein [Polaromonas sp.]